MLSQVEFDFESIKKKTIVCLPRRNKYDKQWRCSIYQANNEGYKKLLEFEENVSKK